jgi:hypothetical protein
MATKDETPEEKRARQAEYTRRGYARRRAAEKVITDKIEFEKARAREQQLDSNNRQVRGANRTERSAFDEAIERNRRDRDG